MHLIIGLGNPGKEYEKTRHNAGFLAVDFIQKRLEFIDFRKDSLFESTLSSGMANETKVLLAKPLTFMNLSGRAVKKIINKNKDFDLKNLLVIYDDIDLSLGTIKFSFDRGDGGHNGIKSIISALKTKKFARLRIGISPIGKDGLVKKPTDKNIRQSFVIKPFTINELSKFNKTLPIVQKAVETFISDGLTKAMDEFN